jgi:hypothetical protein
VKEGDMETPTGEIPATILMAISRMSCIGIHDLQESNSPMAKASTYGRRKGTGFPVDLVNP